MEKRFFYLLVFVMFFTAYTNKAQDYLLDDEKQINYLSKFNKDYETALLNNSLEKLEMYWAEGIRLMPEYQKTVIGKSNALKYHRAFTSRFKVLKYEREKLETLNLDSMIVEFGIFTMVLKLKNTGQEYTLLGNYGAFWKYQNESTLKLVTETWNYSKRVDCAPFLIFDDVPVVNVAMEAHLPIKDNISFELKAINSFTEEFITQHDDFLWSQLYGDDCKLIYSNHPIYSGKEEIKAFLADHVQHNPQFEKLDIRTDKIENFGNYVVEYSSHIAVVKRGDWSGVGTGKNIVVWKREADCSLKIFRSMAMYD